MDYNYIEIIENELRKIGIDDAFISEYALNILKNAKERNIPIVDIIDNGLSTKYITQETIDAINESRSVSSYITIRRFTPEPNKFIRRQIIR